MAEPLPPALPVTEDLATGRYEAGPASTLGHETTHPPGTGGDRPFALPPGYEYHRTLGRGGMGIVFGARQVALKRDVAIKMLLADRGASESQIARFRGEAEAVARFQHPNIVQIFEVGEVQGSPYCVLEYVDGGTLAGRLKSDPVSPADAAPLVEQLARAVHYAHQRHILHRDLKPGNILLTQDGTPKIADFGIAKNLDDDTGQTRDGDVVGTPKYMAPEQARGEQAGLGPHTDVYALGVILYEMLTGEVPFTGANTIEVLNKVREAEPVPPRLKQPKVPVDLETICLKCLRKSPADRYSSALMLAQDLERFQNGEPILAKPEGIARRTMRTLRKRRTTGLAVAAAAAVLLALYFFSGSRKTQQVAGLEQGIQDALASEEWSPETADALEARIAEYGAFEPERSKSLRARAHERYRQSIIAALQNPDLVEADLPAIQRKADDLIRREGSFETDLLKRIGERRSEAIRILDLEAPYTAYEKAFLKPQHVRAGAERLTHESSETTIETTVPSAGAVRVEAHFENWESGHRIAIGLGATDADYRFTLAAITPEGGLVMSPLGAAARGGSLALVIMRGRTLLLVRRVAAPGPVAILRAVRTGDSLSIQLNDRPPDECYDPFPPREAGRIAFDWPQSVGLRRAIATRQKIPRAVNPLERGNLLLRDGAYDDALRFFRQFRQDSKDGPARAEARYKIAVCLAKQSKFAESNEFLEKNDDAEKGRWHALGLYQTWRNHTDAGDFRKGAENFRVLRSLYMPEELLHLIPGPDLWETWEKYDFPQHDVLFTENVADRARTLVEIGDLLRRMGLLSLSNWAKSVQLYCRALQAEGKQKEALTAIAECYHLAEQSPKDELRSVALEHSMEDFIWLLGLTGGHEFALAELKRLEPDADDRSLPSERFRVVLSLHRSRLLAKLGRWSEAERELDLYHARANAPVFVAHLRTNRQGNYYRHGIEHMLRGLIREELGDAAGAAAAYRAGTRKAFLEGLSPEDRTWRASDRDSNSIRDNLYMSARSGTLTDADAASERDGILRIFGNSKAFSGLSTLISLPPETLRRMWLLPSSREAMRTIHFREAGHTEATWLPIRQLAIAVFHVEAVAELTPEREAILSRLTTQMRDVVRGRKIGRSTLAYLGNTWIAGIGAMGPFGWQGAKPGIPKDAVAAAAWVLGHRYLKFNRPDDARTFFQTALDADGPNGTVGKEAKAELDKLDGKGK